MFLDLGHGEMKSFSHLGVEESYKWNGSIQLVLISKLTYFSLYLCSI